MAEALQRSHPPAPSAGPAARRRLALPASAEDRARVRKFLFALSLCAARPPSGTNFLRPQTRTRPTGLSTRLLAAQRTTQVSPPRPPPPPHDLPPPLGSHNLKPTPRRRGEVGGGPGWQIKILKEHLQNKASDLAGWLAGGPSRNPSLCSIS